MAKKNGTRHFKKGILEVTLVKVVQLQVDNFVNLMIILTANMKKRFSPYCALVLQLIWGIMREYSPRYQTALTFLKLFIYQFFRESCF